MSMNYSVEQTKQLRLELFKTSVLSTLYSLFTSRKKQAAAEGKKYLLQDMATAMGADKSQVSRWFNGDANPNWRLSTFYEICDALDGELHVEIVDRRTNELHTPRGVVSVPTIETWSPPVTNEYTVYSNVEYPDFAKIAASSIATTQQPEHRYSVNVDSPRATSAA